MGRPRRYVQVGGKEITGVSRMPDGRFYILIDGRRRYFRSLPGARAAYRATQARHLSAVDLVKMMAIARVREEAAIQALRRSGVHEQRPATINGGAIYVDETSVFHYIESANALAEAVGVPDFSTDEVLPRCGCGRSRHTLTGVISEWKRLKMAAKEGRNSEHIGTVCRVFERFMAVVGDVPVDALAATHFIAWRQWVFHEGLKRQSAKWSNDQHATVKLVIRYVRRHRSDWPWPDGLSDWMNAYDRKAYQPRAANKQPLQVSAFRSLLAIADRWARVDPRAFDSETQQGRGQRRQAFIRQQYGVQLRAMLMLGTNCGLDPADIPRIGRAHLKLDGAVPYLDLPRPKAEHRVGAAIDRKTPLLPSTVRALEAAISSGPDTGPVFRSSRGAPFTGVSRGFRKLADEAGVDRKWSFKHTRNIGPTLAKRGKLSNDERAAFLGHAVNGTSRFYDGEVDETYLTDLVNLIGREYFDGEVVGGTPKLFIP
jgi:integrase